MRIVIPVISIVITCTVFMAGCSSDTPVSSEPDEPRIERLGNALERFDNDDIPQALTPPDDNCQIFDVRSCGDYVTTFNDSNYMHKAAAMEYGIDPVYAVSDIWNAKRPLVPIKPCADFHVEPLTHSYPYLVPEAAQTLHDIGAEFNKRLAQRGAGAYRIRVTSLLRTAASIRSLQKVNTNSVDSSTHMWGTTFDISYTDFAYNGGTTTHHTNHNLSQLLAEVLYDFQLQGRCYVKYELKQPCFHITVRNKNHD